MLRKLRFVLCGVACLALLGCHTSEIKNGNDIGLAKDIPSGSVQSGYGDGKGDSVGGGGAAAPLDASKPESAGEGK